MISTPQDVALKDAIKGVAMFKLVNVPVHLLFYSIYLTDNSLDTWNGTKYVCFHLS